MFYVNEDYIFKFAFSLRQGFVRKVTIALKKIKTLYYILIILIISNLLLILNDFSYKALRQKKFIKTSTLITLL